jgi:hypothetical protein
LLLDLHLEDSSSWCGADMTRTEEEMEPMDTLTPSDQCLLRSARVFTDVSTCVNQNKFFQIQLTDLFLDRKSKTAMNLENNCSRRVKDVCLFTGGYFRFMLIDIPCEIYWFFVNSFLFLRVWWSGHLAMAEWFYYTRWQKGLTLDRFRPPLEDIQRTACYLWALSAKNIRLDDTNRRFVFTTSSGKQYELNDSGFVFLADFPEK